MQYHHPCIYFFLIDLEVLKAQEKQILSLRKERDKISRLVKELSKQKKGIWRAFNEQCSITEMDEYHNMEWGSPCPTCVFGGGGAIRDCYVKSVWVDGWWGVQPPCNSLSNGSVTIPGYSDILTAFLDLSHTYENSKTATVALEKEKEMVSKKPQNDPEFRRCVSAV